MTDITYIIARILGKEDFGAPGMVLSTFGMFGILAGFSLGGNHYVQVGTLAGFEAYNITAKNHA